MRYLFFLFYLPILLLLAGCWDSLEIENRAFVSGVAIDPGENNEDKNLKMMTQIVIPNGLVSLPNNGNGGGKSYRNLSDTGKTIFEVKSAIEEKEDGNLDNSHIELVIISDELVKSEYKLSDILDVFMRESRMNRDIILAIADGSAEDLLNIDPENVKLPSQYMTELIISNYNLANRDPRRAGDMQYYFIENRSFYLPYLVSIDASNGVELEGAAVFKGENGKMVGTLTEEEVSGLLLTHRDYTETLIVDHNGQKASFTVPDGRTEIKLINRDPENLHFQFDVFLTGELVEAFQGMDFIKEENMEELKKKLRLEAEKVMMKTIRKLRDEYRVDILELHEFLFRKHPEIWKQVENDWDSGKNYFSNVDITLNVDVTIREPGNTN
ncbi:Ger(x)C family spore germination protein [Oceanobacillus sp. CFH 90083]|uniref:Ger(x)C family spore germination protein n=1 Tax=Oceanobacillus sp. CFH 90083 TaxID=2592336 RepID=UPI00128D9ACB|nr:Ger(x)C family spore germination protein [Oceanobacillus sp. CFH 90083]